MSEIIGAGSAKDVEVRAALAIELEQFNVSLKGNITIADVKKFSDLPPANSKTVLCDNLIGLYALCKKILSSNLDLSQVNEHVTGSKEAESSDVKMEKTLTKILPDIIAPLILSALSKYAPGALAKDPVQEEAKPEEYDLPETFSLILQHNAAVTEETKDDNGKTIPGVPSAVPIPDESWSVSEKSKVSQTLHGIPVKHASKKLNGPAYVHFSSKESMNQAKDKLTATGEFHIEEKSQKRKKLDPKITISKLDPDITEDNLVAELLSRNHYLKDLVPDESMKPKKEREGLNEKPPLKMIFFERKEGREKYAVLQVSPEIREAIRRNGDKVYLGMSRSYVNDRIHVIQCFHCQGFGHMSGSRCPLEGKAPVCSVCTGRHRTDECTKRNNRETHKCTNCARSNRPNIKATAETHRATDNLCPFFVREKESLMMRTATVTEAAKNEYRQWARELQVKHGRV